VPASWAELPTRPAFYFGSNVINFNRLQKKRNGRYLSRSLPFEKIPLVADMVLNVRCAVSDP